ncbi:DUF4124 domain-containing protein [Nitrosomonas oligotropha]|uniref:DUF4124 domain-containing protein n=1 Tax=Nitrosomonas oligotropha TaxID=42354 RepID=UPI001F03352B|nr:DUF4124 domain-containing protein [Nitrosomonas oligotropha]
MFRSKPVRLLFLLFSLAATAAPASGIYRSVDAQGRVTYSDTPAANAQPGAAQPPTASSRPGLRWRHDHPGRQETSPSAGSQHAGNRKPSPQRRTGGSCRKKMAAKSVAGQSGLSGI